MRAPVEVNLIVPLWMQLPTLPYTYMYLHRSLQFAIKILFCPTLSCSIRSLSFEFVIRFIKNIGLYTEFSW